MSADNSHAERQVAKRGGQLRGATLIRADLVALGIAFYDAQLKYGYSERVARHSAVAYMRRKDADPGDAMPYYEALADALAKRASGTNRISSSYVGEVRP